MKNKIIATLIFFTLIFLIGNTSLRDPFRSILKNKFSQIIKRVLYWEKHNQRFFVDQIFSFNEPFIAYSKQLIYDSKEHVEIFFAGETSVNLLIEQFDNSGNVIFTDSLLIDSPTKIEPLYSSLNGYIGKTSKYKFSPKIKNGWIQILVEPIIGERVYIPVFIQNKENAEIIFVESTDTFNAYISSYRLPTHYGRRLSPLGAFTKPKSSPQSYKIITPEDSINISCNATLINADNIWKKMLIKNEINFKTVSDNYLDNYENFKSSKVLIFGAHNEYWTYRKAENILKFVNNGGNVIFMGGNTAWRAVERHNNFDILYGDDLRDNGFDNIINELLGSYYDMNGYATSAPYKIINSKELKKIIAFENDIKIFAKGTNFDHCKEIIHGGSGHETDKLLQSANKDFILLAKGLNRSNGGANIVFREFLGGGSVLNFGSVSLWHNANDQIIKKLVLSRLNKE